LVLKQQKNAFNFYSFFNSFSFYILCFAKNSVFFSYSITERILMTCLKKNILNFHSSATLFPFPHQTKEHATTQVKMDE